MKKSVWLVSLIVAASMILALAGCGTTGIGRDSFERALGISIRASPEENLEAFSRGFELASGL